MFSGFEARKLVFAVVAVLAATLLFAFSERSPLASIGLGTAITGALDLLFINRSLDGWIAGEVYGDAGEELWAFRSFVLMFGGPLLILYDIIFI